MSRAFFSAFGKRCRVQICCLRQKVSRNDEGRISRVQSALEQDYQNFCTSSSEAGGLPFHHHMHSFTKAQLFLLNARHHVVNALRSERILPSERAVCANYPKGLPFPTKRFATELLCCVNSI